MTDELWTTRSGRQIKVKNMDEGHVRAALNMVLRKQRTRRIAKLEQTLKSFDDAVDEDLAFFADHDHQHG